MINRLALVTAGLAVLFGANAAPLSPEEALHRASSSGIAKSRSLTSKDLRLVHTTCLENGVASSYFFVPSDGVGFTILSADDMAVPVLGYSDSAKIDIDNLPPALVWWINEQARHVEYVQSKNVSLETSQPYAPSDLSPIAPLMHTKWNQDAPYNGQAPMVNGVQAPTGCVATSFAQVMKYFNYPEKGQGSIRYMDNGKSRTMPFTKTFDWDNMLNEYTNSYTDEQADAVALLMKACGYSVEMSYGQYASGAQSYKMTNAAVSYFKYDESIYYTERCLYSSDQWMRMVYDNIKNVGPVIYNGSSIDGGHSFVCDGYDGKGYFHFNWGWGGISDGYYVLDSLNPETQGIGGSEGGFNYRQGAVFNMQPDKGGASEVLYGNMRIYGSATATLQGNSIKFGAKGYNYVGWANASFRDIKVTVGAIFSKIGESSIVAEVPGVLNMASVGSLTDIELSPVSYYSAQTTNPIVDIPNLPDGVYKVTLATKDNEYEDSPWQPMMCEWGASNYCTLTVKDGKYSVSSVDPLSLVFENCELDSPLYLYRNAKLVYKIKNTTDEQLSVCFSPVLVRNGVIQYQGDMMLTTVDAGATSDMSSVVAFYEVDGATKVGFGTYELKILDRSTNEIIASFGEYEMSSVTGSTKITLDDFSIVNTPQENVTVGNRTFKDAYVVKDLSDFEVYMKYTVSRGYMDKSISILCARYDVEESKFIPYESKLYYDQPFAGEGEQEEVTLPLDFSSYDRHSAYRLTAAYFDGARDVSLGAINFVFDNTGVDSIVDTANPGEVVYYNIQGVRIDTPQKGQVVIKRTGERIEKFVF